ncbi:MAG: hypothetical protein HJJLKODD_02038 [Phycisphaerae bacterium]|nr:hypothetical protein [Phycisphaerae bacterium]
MAGPTVRGNISLAPLVHLFLLVVGGAALFGLDHLEARYQQQPPFQQPARIELLNLPQPLRDQVLADISEFVGHPWIDESLCDQLTAHLLKNGWIKSVRMITKPEPGLVRIDCEYRQPLLLVEHDEYFYLVDEEGIRLPGEYTYDPEWLVVQGVKMAPPGEGKLWVGNDLHGALLLANMINSQTYNRQVAKIVVDNYGGRRDRQASPLLLITDQGSRISWGSAPGEEMEENSTIEKLSLLAQNFQHTGRIDAHYPQIDISIFPDRIVIPADTQSVLSNSRPLSEEH